MLTLTTIDLQSPSQPPWPLLPITYGIDLSQESVQTPALSSANHQPKAPISPTFLSLSRNSAHKWNTSMSIFCRLLPTHLQLVPYMQASCSRSPRATLRQHPPRIICALLPMTDLNGLPVHKCGSQLIRRQSIQMTSTPPPHFTSTEPQVTPLPIISPAMCLLT